ncbi:MAG: hypothetical protein AAF999_07020 [Pseudomonadota bacterium]
MEKTQTSPQDREPASLVTLDPARAQPSWPTQLRFGMRCDGPARVVDTQVFDPGGARMRS